MLNPLVLSFRMVNLSIASYCHSARLCGSSVVLALKAPAFNAIAFGMPTTAIFTIEISCKTKYVHGLVF